MTDVRLTALNPEDSKVYPVACNASGELLTDKAEIGPNISIEGNLDVGGAAIFAGSITSNGITQYALPPMGGGGQLGWDNDTKSFRLYANSSTNADAKIQFHFNQSDTADITFNQGGSATFSGAVTVGESATGVYLNSNGEGRFRGRLRVDSYIQSFRDNGSDVVFSGYEGSDLTPNVNIFASGSASFNGEVIIGSKGTKWLIRESNGVAMLIEQTRRGAIEPRKELRTEEVRDLPRELDLVEAALSEVMGKLKMTPPAGWPVWDGSDDS
jgi:hypothetical protein